MDQTAKQRKKEASRKEQSSKENMSSRSIPVKEEANSHLTYKTEALACFVRMMPFVVSISIIVFLGFSFIFAYIYPLLTADVTDPRFYRYVWNDRDGMDSAKKEGWVYLGIFLLLYGMVWFAFLSATISNPGYVNKNWGITDPIKTENDKETMYMLMVATANSKILLREAKNIPKSTPSWMYSTQKHYSSKQFIRPYIDYDINKCSVDNGIGMCGVCFIARPQRSHHCMFCERCILKRDHHCPWILNCVGYNNYKAFYLLLIYTWVTCFYILAVYWKPLYVALTNPLCTLGFVYITALEYTISAGLGVSVFMFFIFHSWLISKGMTTQEYNMLYKNDANKPRSDYNVSCSENMTNSLGKKKCLWVVPICNRISSLKER